MPLSLRVPTATMTIILLFWTPLQRNDEQALKSRCERRAMTALGHLRLIEGLQVA